jgi:signal transduction histidine kinase
MVGHELRNPLAAIRGAHEYVQRRLNKQHPGVIAAEPKVVQLLEVGTREVEACNRLINALLDFARERPLALEPCPLRAVVEEGISLVPARAEVAVVNEVPEDIPVPDLDREQFRRLIVNLVQNAVDAFPEGKPGQVRVEAGHDGGKWRLSVADDGPGIPEEIVERIFEPLFTTKAKGTGLGLAVVHGVVQRHGAKLAVDTKIGSGTCFRVEWAALSA